MSRSAGSRTQDSGGSRPAGSSTTTRSSRPSCCADCPSGATHRRSHRRRTDHDGDRGRSAGRPTGVVRRRIRLRHLRPHQHRPSRRPRPQLHRLRHRPARTGRGPRRRRLRPGLGKARRPAHARRPRHDERGDRRRHRRPGLRTADRHLRRHPHLLLRPPPAPGGQPPRRRRPDRDLPAVLQAGLARATHLRPAPDHGARLLDGHLGPSGRRARQHPHGPVLPPGRPLPAGQPPPARQHTARPAAVHRGAHRRGAARAPSGP